ncbi:MAG TPA: helix-turn-helix domain-containing protein, partial [Planctomycetia bacterium]|nr:helix-turn-helix domain-containing protein [Planctomycetia bacterium]
EITRAGANEPVKVNVRLVSATNRDLDEMVKEGKFRQDLYFRLKVVSLTLPPLRERRSDIALLSKHFLNEFSHSHGRPEATISNAAMRVLQACDWPGNVRELRNALESMFVMDVDGRIDLDDFPEELLKHHDAGFSGTQESLIGRPLDEVEAYYIEQALKMTGGNREEAAKMLSIGERTLYRKIEQYKIPALKSRQRGKSSGERA